LNSCPSYFLKLFLFSNLFHVTVLVKSKQFEEITWAAIQSIVGLLAKEAEALEHP
jgi:hypothetical protein